MIYKSKIFPNKSRENETKFAIFKVIRYSGRYLSPREIANMSGLTLAAVQGGLKRYYRDRFIYRAKERRRTYRNYYCYRSLRPRGEDYYIIMSHIDKYREETGEFVPMIYKFAKSKEFFEMYRNAFGMYPSYYTRFLPRLSK